MNNWHGKQFEIISINFCLKRISNWSLSVLETFADPDDSPGRDKGTKTANGCDKGTAKNNPNCGVDGIDTDGDGLTDDEELLLGTNPNHPDTDGDGLLDGEDPCPLQIPARVTSRGYDHDDDGTLDKSDKTPCGV